jgi:hypothetical protein
MSEYQYYEFRAVDRPLTEKMTQELRSLSTRAEITPTSFSNEYSYGNFRGDPKKLMEKYFDAFLYVANWGTHRLVFRLPAGALEVGQVKEYALDEAVSIRTHGGHILIELVAQEEGGYWEEGEGRMDSLLPLREDLLAGDLRCLYLGWLRGLEQSYDLDEDASEPPVPAGLGTMSKPLKDLAEFLWLDDNLLAAATEASSRVPAEPSPAESAAWVKSLPASEKDEMLLRVLQDEARSLRGELLRRFRKARGGAEPAPTGRRTVGQLLAARDRQQQQAQRREEQRLAEEEARRQRQEAEARERRLGQLAGHQAEAWRQVDSLIASSQPKPYDEVVTLLQDLQALAEREGRRDEATQRIRQLREQHARKRTLIQRLDRASLGK